MFFLQFLWEKIQWEQVNWFPVALGLYVRAKQMQCEKSHFPV